MSFTIALLAGCAQNNPEWSGVPPLDEYLRQPCQLPQEIKPAAGRRADLGDMTQRAVENAMLVHECEKRRAGAVQAYDKARASIVVQ